MPVTFKDYRVKVKDAINQNCESFLHEATGEIASQAADNSPIDTGQLKGSWGTAVNGNEGIVGNTEKHSIWNEFGTGEYAMKGDGRKGGWAYQDDNENWHFTKGTKPKRMLFNAFNTKKAAIIARAQQIFGGMK
jgi:hypothetical protein